MAPQHEKALRLDALMSAYRDWLLEEAAREVERGCSRLLGIQSTLLQYFRDVTIGWPSAQILLLMRARIKRLRCYGLTPLPLTAEEEKIVGTFDWPVLQLSTHGRPQTEHRSPTGSRMIDVDKVGLANLMTRAGEFRVAKARMRRYALDCVPDEFGKPFNLNDEYLYWLPIDGLTVETDVDLARSAHHQLQYWHVLYPGSVGVSNRMVAEHSPRLSIVHLLGVNAGITSWDCLTDAIVPTATEQLGVFVRNFIDAVPGIIERARQAEPPIQIL